MPKKLNKSLLSGNLTHDLELKEIGESNAVVNFQVAVNDDWFKDGQRNERTQFLNCVIFGDRARNMAKHVAKGTALFLEGKLVSDTYEQDGKKIASMKVHVLDWQFDAPPKS